MARHKAVIAVGENGLMVVDGTKCKDWPLWGRYGLLRPNGISTASFNNVGVGLGIVKANDNG